MPLDSHRRSFYKHIGAITSLKRIIARYINPAWRAVNYFVAPVCQNLPDWSI